MTHSVNVLKWGYSHWAAVCSCGVTRLPHPSADVVEAWAAKHLEETS
jgi:hypothetical protein